MRRSILLSILLTLITVNAISKSYVGIDISHHQGRIVWTEVAKENIDFVYIKATEGATYVDPCFHYNMKGATDAGFYVGAYHYFRMTSSAKEQFEPQLYIPPSHTPPHTPSHRQPKGI